jgi:hypothetical protein
VAALVLQGPWAAPRPLLLLLLGLLLVLPVLLALLVLVWLLLLLRH